MEKKRKVIDCRLVPSENNCSLAISGTESEVLECSMQHIVQSHKGEDTPEMREEIRKAMQDAKD